MFHLVVLLIGILLFRTFTQTIQTNDGKNIKQVKERC